MAKFANNNAKNATIEYTHFEFNYKYYLYVSYKDNVNSYSKFKSVDKLAVQLRNLIAVYRDNFYYTQKL